MATLARWWADADEHLAPAHVVHPIHIDMPSGGVVPASETSHNGSNAMNFSTIPRSFSRLMLELAKGPE